MKISVSTLLLWLAAAFLIWDCLTYAGAGISHEGWLLPGGLAAWVLSLIIPF